MNSGLVWYQWITGSHNPFFFFFFALIPRSGKTYRMESNVVVGQLLSCIWIFENPWTAALQASLSFTISQSLLKLMPIPSNHLVLCCFLLPLSSVFPSIRVSSNESTLPTLQMAKVLELQLQHQHQSFQWIFRINFFYDWLVWSPCSAKDSQESSLTTEFKSINSSVPSLLHGPTLISIHDY